MDRRQSASFFFFLHSCEPGNDNQHRYTCITGIKRAGRLVQPTFLWSTNRLVVRTLRLVACQLFLACHCITTCFHESVKESVLVDACFPGIVIDSQVFWIYRLISNSGFFWIFSRKIGELDSIIEFDKKINISANFGYTYNHACDALCGKSGLHPHLQVK
jgi:hypothetical protein